jgi:Fe-S-cluster containining protein
MSEQPFASPETVAVDFSIGIGDSIIAATAVVPAGRTNLTQLLPVIQSLDDVLIDAVAAQSASEGRPVSCKAGCGACCRPMVAISVFEAEYLAAWIQTLPEAQQQEIARRFDQALRSLAEAGIVDRLVEMGADNPHAASELSADLTRDYFYARVPCPFLQDESCSIHPIRPLVCREHLVVTPFENCYDPGAHQVLTLEMPITLFPVLNNMGAQVERDGRGWIPLVFLFAWMKAGAHPGKAISGNGPEVLYQFVSRIRQTQFPMPPPSPSSRVPHP